jgi:ribosomal protein L11 methyltransferase
MRKAERMADEYQRFWINCAESVGREWLLAEAFEAGAGGAEEQEEGGRFRACIYVSPDRIEAVRRVLCEIAPPTTLIGETETPAKVDWSEAWKEGLEALSISSRLLVRPPFIEVALEPGQREIVIDPGQAFGTGAHASTYLCLEWLNVLIREEGDEGEHEGEALEAAEGVDRVLDVGTGSGVLALAAVALGAKRAVGFDLDPVAIEAAVSAADSNGLADEVHFFIGPIEALGEAAEESRAAYPLVLANLLKREMLPIATEIAAWTSVSGHIVLAGLLEEDVAEVLERFGRESFVEVGRRTRQDNIGLWVGLCLAREASA